MIARSLKTIVVLLCLSPALVLFQNFAKTGDPKPNIIYIMLDDAGYQDFIKYKTDSQINHKGFQFLEENAVKFTHFYTNPTCSPTRMSIMTGKNPASFGVEHALCVPDSSIPNDPFGSARGIPTTEMTIVKKLNSAGYRTAHVGKWHIGERPGKKPSDQGFHDTIVYRYDNHNFWDPYMFFYSGTQLTNRWSGNKKQGVIKGHKTDVLTKYAREILDNHEANHKDKPLFLNVWFNAPHHPFTPKDKFLANYGYANLQALKDSGLDASEIDLIKFKAVMDHVDQKIKGIIDHVRTSDHFKKNTIIMLTSDNGGAAKKGNYSNDPLLGSKGKLLEGAVRLPLYVYWGGVLDGGVENHTVLRSSDLLLTFTDLARASRSGIDSEGESFAHLLTNTTSTDHEERSQLIFWNQRGQIKYCTNEYSTFVRESHWDRYATWRQGIRDGDWKYIHKKEDGVEQEFLFDFSTIERETENVGHRFNLVNSTDTAHQAKLNEMRTKLKNAVIDKSQLPAKLAAANGTVEISGTTMTFPGTATGGRARINKHDLYEFHDGSFTFSIRVRPYNKSIGEQVILADRKNNWSLALLPTRHAQLTLKAENYDSEGKAVLNDVVMKSSTRLNAGENYNITFTITGHVGNADVDKVSRSECTSEKKKTFINNVARLYVDPVTRTAEPDVEDLNATDMANVAFSGYDNPVFLGRSHLNTASESFFGRIDLLGAFALPLTPAQLKHLYSTR